LLDDAGRLDGEIHAAHGAHRADRLDARGPGYRLDGGGRHRCRRDRHGGEILLDRLVAEQVEADDAADHENEQDEGDDEALEHGWFLGRDRLRIAIHARVWTCTGKPESGVADPGAPYCTVQTVLSIGY